MIKISVEDFRLSLIKDFPISGMLYIDSGFFSYPAESIFKEVDPNQVFLKEWKTGIPVSEIYTEYSTKELLKVSKNIKALEKNLEKIALEAPRHDNPQNIIHCCLVVYASRLLKIVSGITFEKPKLFQELPENWKKGITRYRKEWRDYSKVVSELLIPTTHTLKNDSIDRYTGKYDSKEIEKFMLSENEFYGPILKLLPKLLPESIVLGWFKEFRDHNNNSSWFENYLKTVSISKYTSDDLKLLLLFAEIKDEEELSLYGSDDTVDLFWDNTDKIYEKLFHENIDDTPTFLTRLFISMFII